MRDWLRGKAAGAGVFVLIAGLVLGGLGWATAAALRLEREQLAERAAAERRLRLRPAMWQLETYVAPFLAREDGRPLNHYSALFATPVAFNTYGNVWATGAVMEPTPLLGADLKPWLLLHFQTAADTGWESPQVPPPELLTMLRGPRPELPLRNVTAARAALLDDLACSLPAERLLTLADQHVSPDRSPDTALLAGRPDEPQQQQQDRQGVGQGLNPGTQPAPQQAFPNQPAFNQQKQQAYGGQQGNVANIDEQRANYLFRLQDNNDRNPVLDRELALGNTARNGSDWFNLKGNARRGPYKDGPPLVPGDGKGPKGDFHPGEGPTRPRAFETSRVEYSPMAPVWAAWPDGSERLLYLRLVWIEGRQVCQGVVLDADALREELAAQVADIFPEARVEPLHDGEEADPDRAMTSLPFQLVVGDAPPPASPGWSPLRVGLALAWLAALVALGAVGLGGWSLLDLSERRIRFVSAVTHELRTPLTTLRLYLDMLLNGLVRDEKQREEYLRTLHAEADRLTRLVGNVLDFSRLEKQRPNLQWEAVPAPALLDQVAQTWSGRCGDAEKELVVEGGIGADKALWTDPGLVQQVLGNLIDNACKYSRDAADRRIWLRSRVEGGRVVLEVEDRGPGVPAAERRAIFRAFRRGGSADVTAGGVGLGLALAKRWAKLLGGRLVLAPPPAEGGACFRLVLPLQAPPPAP
jgi:signal transduction histidine kinase